MLKAAVLIDNISKNELLSEWGFCVYVEYEGKRFLLDTGSSDKYLENAKKLGISVENVDYAVLSHAHYDHSGGYTSFFSENGKATLFINESCRENCYHKFGLLRKYIGLPKGVFSRYESRIRRIEGIYKLTDGVYIIPHLENGLEKIGKKAHLYRREGRRLLPDDFCHEQSLVFDTEKGLVIMNSCSHAGLDNILEDVACYFPGKHVYMTVGGLHLSRYGESEIRKTARKIKELDIDRVVTGHCTGDKAFAILKEELGERAEQTFSGMEITV